MTDVQQNRTTPPVDVLAGGGEMGRRIREFDWGSTSLGPIESWSPALRTMVRVLVANRFPHILWWGPEYVQFYNDAYRPIPGAKHPHRVLGRPASECWSEIWHVIGPLIDKPYNGGPATWDEDILLEINRHGYFEESHFTIAYSPVPDESVSGGIGGVLATVHEITDQVVADRRMVALRDLGARAVEAKSADEACAIVADTLAHHDKDLPFAVLYLIDAVANEARLAGVAGVSAAAPVSPLRVDLSAPSGTGWPLVEASGDQALRVVENISQRFQSIPAGPWLDAPHTAVVVPIPASKPQELAGFLIVGVSARRRFDESYRSFLELVRTQVANAIAKARAYDDERQRAEATNEELGRRVAELERANAEILESRQTAQSLMIDALLAKEKLRDADRRKDEFLATLAHELRNPLAPVRNAVAILELKGPEDPERQWAREVIDRQMQQMSRLVDDLLDVSRISRGKIELKRERLELAKVIHGAVEASRPLIEQCAHELSVTIPTEAIHLEADGDATDPGVLQPAQQRGQVQREPRSHRRRRRARGP
jgi:signal transduction histidine kinase